jgi:predicted Zn-ribbon and HTH transcriptional regulator
MLRYYALATAAIIAAATLAGTYSDSPWMRRSMLAGVVGLVVAGAFVQLRERCPRCAARISAQTRLLLPAKCKKCGVIFDGPEVPG